MTTPQNIKIFHVLGMENSLSKVSLFAQQYEIGKLYGHLMNFCNYKIYVRSKSGHDLLCSIKNLKNTLLVIESKKKNKFRKKHSANKLLKIEQEYRRYL